MLEVVHLQFSKIPYFNLETPLLFVYVSMCDTFLISKFCTIKSIVIINLLNINNSHKHGHKTSHSY